MPSIRELNERTALSIKIIVPLIFTIVSCTTYLVRELYAIKSYMSQGWTLRDMTRWSNQLRSTNPQINVPDPDFIFDSRPKAIVNKSVPYENNIP